VRRITIRGSIPQSHHNVMYTSEASPQDKSKSLIVLHIRSTDGFIPGAFCVLNLKVILVTTMMI